MRNMMQHLSNITQVFGKKAADSFLLVAFIHKIDVKIVIIETESLVYLKNLSQLCLLFICIEVFYYPPLSADSWEPI